MATQQQSNRANKGNPAGHRMSNPRNKTYRKSLRVKQDIRKAARRQAQAAAEARNKARGFTTWEAAKAARAEKRAA